MNREPKSKIEQDKKDLYKLIVKSIEEGNKQTLPRYYVISWWLNSNNNEEITLTTPQVNSRLRSLVKDGYLTRKTFHYGVEYKLTEKVFNA